MFTAQQLYYIWSLLRRCGGDRLYGCLLSSTFSVIPRYDSWRPVYPFLIVYNKKKREFKKQNRWNFNEISCFVLFTRAPREIRSLLWVRFRIICYEQKALLVTKRTQKIRGLFWCCDASKGDPEFWGSFGAKLVQKFTIPRVCKAILQRSNKTTYGMKHKAFDFTNY